MANPFIAAKFFIDLEPHSDVFIWCYLACRKDHPTWLHARGILGDDYLRLQHKLFELAGHPKRVIVKTQLNLFLLDYYAEIYESLYGGPSAPAAR